MPKSASPVRLQQELMQSATLAGARHHRSAAEQIEYWATLGRQVAGVLDPDKLLDVLSGLAAVRVEPVTTAAVAPEQASTAHLGFLEEIASDGRRRLGQFRHGVFEPVEESAQHHTS